MCMPPKAMSQAIDTVLSIQINNNLHALQMVITIKKKHLVNGAVGAPR